MAKTIAEVAQERMAAMVERELESMWGTTSTATEQEPLTLPKLEVLCRDWGNMIRNARRTQIRFQVAFAHIGPMIQNRHPVDGTVIECSYRQAQTVHEHWPLVLDEVLDTETAFFRPASGLGFEFVPKILPMPPYDPPEEHSTPPGNSPR